MCNCKSLFTQYNYNSKYEQTGEDTLNQRINDEDVR